MKVSRLLTFGLLSLSCVNSAFAEDPFPKAYDATYESKSTYGTTQMHMLSNGKGQMRTETSQPGGSKMVTILDIPGRTSYAIIEAQKMIMKSPYKGGAAKVIDEAEAKRLNATDLGTKMVNNHMCQGWSYKTPQAATEVWSDKEAHVMVQSKTTSGKITTETNMKSLSTNPPGDSLFKVPASGYKVMATQ
jgi:hypothetical protein